MIVAGITGPLQNVLRHVLDWLHGTIGLPWAWSIVGLTVIVRMLLVPLTVKQIHSMQSLQRHAPEMKAIQQRHKGDKQKLNEELMKFYKENKINPAASCLPMLAQFPVFIALFFVLREFSKKPPPGSLAWLHIFPNIAHHADKIGWPGYLLLAIYAGSQVTSTLLMGTTMDKTQRNLLMFLPLVFIVVVKRFPTGLLLYWVTTNLWTVGQGLITRKLVPKAVPLPKRTSRTPRRDDDAGDGAKTAPAAPKPSPAASAPPKVVRRKKKKKTRR